MGDDGCEHEAHGVWKDPRCVELNAEEKHDNARNHQIRYVDMSADWRQKDVQVTSSEEHGIEHERLVHSHHDPGDDGVCEDDLAAVGRAFVRESYAVEHETQTSVVADCEVGGLGDSTEEHPCQENELEEDSVAK